MQICLITGFIALIVGLNITILNLWGCCREGFFPSVHSFGLITSFCPPYTFIMKTNTILQGDSLEVLKTFDDDSIDLIASDPPYQLDSITKPRPDQTKEGSYGKEVPFSRQQSRIKGFMGKEWDVLPQVPLLKECLRVLKAGAFSFWLMTPRQDSQAEFVIRLKQAGFNIGFTPLYWAYASGFPKAGNISKMVDKRMGVEREVVGKRFDGATSYLHTTEKNDGRTQQAIDNCQNKQEIDITSPSTPQAKALDGSYAGYQPKPAVEIIIVAMKPLSEKTYIDQALKNNKGITWLDDVRVPHNDMLQSQSGHQGQPFGEREHTFTPLIYTTQGRFPANLLVSDDVLNDGNVTKSIRRKMGVDDTIGIKTGMFDGGWVERGNIRGHNDSGSFSRYFDLDKWHINKLPKAVKETFPFMIVPKASSGEKNDGLKGFEDLEAKPLGEHCLSHHKGSSKDKRTGKRKDPPKKNFHPTVKPTKLMEYLITLGSRKGDLILDPFIGSGTTAIASRILSRKFIGIEKDKEYHKIAVARIKEHLEQRKIYETFLKPSKMNEKGGSHA